MSSHQVILLLSAIAVSAICGAVLPIGGPSVDYADLTDHPSSRLIGGSPVQSQQFKHVASLQSYTQGHLCGAAIVNQYYLLTAANCLVGQTAQALRVRVGSKQLHQYGVLHLVNRIRKHDQFNAYTRQNDIATVRTSRAIEFNANVASVSIATFQYGVTAAVVAGWGRTKKAQNSGHSQQLQQLTTRTLLNTDCKQRYANKPVLANNLLANNICSLTAQKGVCEGDAGSPLTVNGELIGLVSWTQKDCASGLPDVYVRVSSFIGWIAQNTRDN